MRPPHPRPRIHAAAAAASLLLHALLLLAIGRWYGSAGGPSPPRAVGPTIAVVDVLPASPAPPIVRPLEPPTPPAERAPPAAADTAGSPTRSAIPAPELAPLSASSGGPESAAAALRAGFTNPRLHVQPDALAPDARASTMEESFRAALQADDEAVARREREELARRQITLFGRKVTVFGDSSKVNWRDLTVILAGKRAVLPIDGREWEDLQMRKQNMDFVRDSILRERVRATRERRK